MIEQLSRNKKWSDYINYKEDENRIAFIIAVIVVLISILCRFYDNFQSYQKLLQDVLLSIGCSALGIVGVALSGVAIITGLFSRKQVYLIEKHNGTGTFEKVMSSFLFLAFNCAIVLLYSIILIFLIQSQMLLPVKVIFYIIEMISIYFVVFNLFYAVSLVGNCISIFKIRNIYDSIKEKDFFDEANEVRIDMIYNTLLNKYNVSQEEFFRALEETINNSDIENKRELMEYFYKYYNVK